MSKTIAITVENTLQELVLSAIEILVNECIKDSIKDGQFDIYELGYKAQIIAGECVPYQTYYIKCLWFTETQALKDAYDDAGLGDEATSDDSEVAIQCFIEDGLNRWLSKNQDELDEINSDYWFIRCMKNTNEHDGSLFSMSELELNDKLHKLLNTIQ
jgi:hypothetical protein